jgi:uncharacterized protein (DUF924 family)
MYEMETPVEKKWFGAAPEVDAELRALFQDDVEAAAREDYDSRLESTEEGLSSIIRMEFFTCNMYQVTAEMCRLPALSIEWIAMYACMPSMASCSKLVLMVYPLWTRAR